MKIMVLRLMSECSKSISINANGEIEKGKNVVIVCPNATISDFTNETVIKLNLIHFFERIYNEKKMYLHRL